jgi:hypothetical protein
LQRIADGSLKASVVGGKFAAKGTAAIGGFHVMNTAWDKIYVNLGYDKLDREEASNKALDKYLKRQTESINMDSKHVLDTIIKETLQSEQLTLNKPTVNSKVTKPTVTPKVTKPTVTPKPVVAGPFKNQAEGDAFRAWMIAYKPSAARSLKLDKTGPFDNDVIKNAYKIHGDEYKQYNADNTTDLNDFTSLSGLQWTLLLLVAGVVGFSVYKSVRLTSYLLKYRKDLIPLLRRGNFKDFNQLIRSKAFRQMSKEQQRKAIELLKNPGMRVKLESAIDETLISSFFKNEGGVTAADLRKILTKKQWKKYGPAIEKEEAKRAGKSGIKYVGPKPIKIVKKTRDAKWTGAQSLNLNIDTYANELKNAGIYSPNDQIAFKKGLANDITGDFNTIKQQFANAPGSKNSVWILNKHIDSNTFPNFLQWQKDLMAANPKFDITLLNSTRYRRAKAKWYIVKHF